MPLPKPTKKTAAKRESQPKAKPAAKPAVKKVVKEARPKPPKRPAVATVPEKTEEEKLAERYWEAVGRRKTAVARVRLYTRGEKGVWVAEKPLADYFPEPHLQRLASEALETMNVMDRFRVVAKVKGGGVHAQAEAIRHGTARALILFNPDFRKRIKRAGLLTRDPRMKERKKFGLKGARRAPQWAKR